jgi:WXXGXW repeat (2 copies)
MNMRMPFAVAIAAALFAAAIVAVPARAQISAQIVIGTPPPAPVVVAPPPPRPGYVWAPGFWGWERGRHVWHDGYWLPARPGAVYVPAQWVAVRGGWRFVPGHWAQGGPPGPPGGCPPGLAKQGRC